MREIERSSKRGRNETHFFPGNSAGDSAGKSTDLLDAIAEASKHLSHIAILLHGDDATVILLVHPHQKVLVLIVPS